MGLKSNHFVHCSKIMARNTIRFELPNNPQMPGRLSANLELLLPRIFCETSVVQPLDIYLLRFVAQMSGLSHALKKYAATDRFTVEAVAVVQEVIEATLLDACQVQFSLFVPTLCLLYVLFRNDCTPVSLC
jgi:hypothetical protein